MCVSTGWTRLGIGGQALNRKKAPASRHKTECELVRSAMVETEAGRTEARASVCTHNKCCCRHRGASPHKGCLSITYLHFLSITFMGCYSANLECHHSTLEFRIELIYPEFTTGMFFA